MTASESTDLSEGFEGTVLEDGDAGFEEAREIFNAMIDRRPSVIAQCQSVADVQAAIAHARANGLEIAIRSGGHSVAGASLSDGGLVVDMRHMNAVEVDPEARTATVAGGATWSSFDQATQPHGLMAPGGRVSTTGVAGLTLGGGSTWLERKFGFACDNLLEVELVTADGRVVTAGEDSNPELFWALHGGGGNFGVATRLVFRLHQLPAASLALLLWPVERGEEITRTYRDLVDGGMPEEVGGGVAFITGPPEEFVPEHLQGQLTAGVICIYAGTEAEMREALAPILALKPEAELIAEMPYAEIQCAIDDPPGFRNYWSAEHLTGFPDEAVSLFCRRARTWSCPRRRSTSPSRGAPRWRAVPRTGRCRIAPPRGASIRSASGSGPRTTSRRSRGRAGSAPTFARGRRGTSTSTSSATRARTGCARATARRTTRAWRRSRPSSTPTMSSTSITRSGR